MSQRFPRDDRSRQFFCELCQKGYARQIDLDHHENDYDHQHRKREKDRKELSRDFNAEAKAKAAERRANQSSDMRTISVAGKVGGLKKAPVFRPVGEPRSTQPVEQQKLNVNDPSSATVHNDPSGAVRNDWYKDRYDPLTLTDCDSSCPACHGQDNAICL